VTVEGGKGLLAPADVVERDADAVVGIGDEAPRTDKAFATAAVRQALEWSANDASIQGEGFRVPAECLKWTGQIPEDEWAVRLKCERTLGGDEGTRVLALLVDDHREAGPEPVIVGATAEGGTKKRTCVRPVLDREGGVKRLLNSRTSHTVA